MHRLLKTAFASFFLLCPVPFASAWDFDSTTKAQIDTDVDYAIHNLYATVPGSKDVVSRAAGVLVFPRAGFMVGGQHGGGALRVGGENVGYYHTDQMTVADRPGASSHSVAIVFMTKDALQRFQANDDWNVGADPSVAEVTAATLGKVEASQTDKPVQMFIYGDNGLTGPVALQGAKITKAG
jgi:lipid-binding SYLF domain-containing protein